MENFEKLEVWQRALDLAIEVYAVVKSNFPQHERYGLSSQICRSAVSIGSNIAEGSARNSGKAYLNYLQIALGSSFETYSHIIIAEKIGYISSAKKVELADELIIIQKMLVSFMKYIETKYNN